MRTAKIENHINKNLGIQLLRTLLSFWVILDHCISKKIKMEFDFFFKNRLHVPCFILISFFFSYKTITERNIIKIRKRFERLLIPYIVYPIIILLINNILFIFFKINFCGNKYTLHDLIIQLILGRKIIDVFWFQFYCIWTTLLFVIISFVMKKNYLIVLEHIYIFSYIIRYSNINYYFFYQYKPIIRYSIGQFVEVMPMSVSGSFIASLSIISKIKNYYKKVLYFSCVGLFIILKYNIFSNVKRFAFGGIILDVGSILFFFIFYLIPLDIIFKYPIIKIIINQLTNYTQGIYCFHLIVQRILFSRLNSINKGYLSGCIIIHILSYFISFIGEKLTRKTKLVYLFI